MPRSCSTEFLNGVSVTFPKSVSRTSHVTTKPTSSLNFPPLLCFLKQPKKTFVPFLFPNNGSPLYERAKDFYLCSDYIKAFEVIEEMFSAQGNDDSEANILQGNIFKNLAKKTENLDLKIRYLLNYVECYSRNASSSVYSAEPLFNLAEQIGSVLYNKKSLVKAKESLSFYADFPIWKDEKEKTEYRIKLAESRIADFKTRVGFAEQDVTESKKHEKNKLGMVELVLFRRMRSYWKDLDVDREGTS